MRPCTWTTSSAAVDSGGGDRVTRLPFRRPRHEPGANAPAGRDRGRLMAALWTPAHQNPAQQWDLRDDEPRTLIRGSSASTTDSVTAAVASRRRVTAGG